jgi:hypothetical protein
LASGVFVAIIAYLRPNSALFGASGLIAAVLQLLAILAPFYIAALAAVATFGDKIQIDKPMKGTQIPSIDLKVKGEWQSVEITTRYFLSMLFAYCSAVSVGLFLIGLVAAFFAGAIKLVLNPEYVDIVKYTFVFIYVLFFSHLVLTTMIGIYFLGDKIHRPND